MEDLRKKIFV